MPQLTLDIPVNGIDALAARWGYDQLVVPEGQTAPTKAAFVRNRLTSYMREEARAHLQATAAAAAAAAVQDPF